MKEAEITKQSLAKLRARLPLNYAKTIAKTIKKKHEKVITVQHIRRTLCTPPKKFPNTIIEEAVKLAAKQDKARKTVKKTIHDW